MNFGATILYVFDYSSFGFGIMNGDRIVTVAQNWKNVPDFKVCEVSNSVLGIITLFNP